MGQHTLAGLLAAGAKVTVNSDDPAYFGGYMNDNIRAVQAAFHFDAATWQCIARNSFEASFVDEAQKVEWIKQLDAVFAVDR
jgi:adenosine deaminase